MRHCNAPGGVDGRRSALHQEMSGARRDEHVLKEDSLVGGVILPAAQRHVQLSLRSRRKIPEGRH
jgi:hypothetical protein